MAAAIKMRFQTCLIAAAVLVYFFYLGARHFYNNPCTRQSQSVNSVKKPHSFESVYTSTFTVEPTHLCQRKPSSKDVPLDMLIVIFSRVRAFERRKKIRRSWANSTNYPNLQVGHVVGEESDALHFEDIMKMAREEAFHENDTLLVPYHDTWRNVSYKNLASLDFFNKNCKDVPFIVRLDDELDNQHHTINLQNLVNFVNSIPRGMEGMFGKVLKAAALDRDPLSKYYTPKTIFNESVLPPFVVAEAVVFTRGITMVLFDKLLHIDYDNRMLDDNLLGLAAKKAGIKRMDVGDLAEKLGRNKTDAQDWTFTVYD